MKRKLSIAGAIALAGVAALLIGFQGVTTVLTVAEYGASPPKPAANAGQTNDAGRPSSPAPAVQPSAGREVKRSDAPHDSTVQNPSTAQNPPTEGIAAAARAKALAEIEAMGQATEQAAENETPSQRPQRATRAPRSDKHRVY